MLYSQMLTVFTQNGVVESDSPKNRKKLYNQLRQDGVKWKTEIIGYTKGERSMSRWLASPGKIGWSLGRVCKWIREKRLLPDDLKEACEHPSLCEYFKFNDIKEVFNENMSGRDRFELIEQKWGYNMEWVKYTPFDLCVLHKSIVRISCVNE